MHVAADDVARVRHCWLVREHERRFGRPDRPRTGCRSRGRGRRHARRGCRARAASRQRRSCSATRRPRASSPLHAPRAHGESRRGRRCASRRCVRASVESLERSGRRPARDRYARGTKRRCLAEVWIGDEQRARTLPVRRALGQQHEPLTGDVARSRRRSSRRRAPARAACAGCGRRSTPTTRARACDPRPAGTRAASRAVGCLTTTVGIAIVGAARSPSRVLSSWRSSTSRAACESSRLPGS